MLEKKIAYYTRKVAEYGCIPINKRNKYRHSRLLVYKKILNNKIKGGS